MQLGISLLQEANDHVGALQSAGGFTGTGFCGGSALLRFGGTAEAAVSTWFLLTLWLVLKREAGIFLIALGSEADVVELNLIRAGLGHELGQSDVVILNFGIRRIGPYQLAVFTPGLLVSLRLYGQLGMLDHHALVAEDGDAGDGVHVLRVQEVYKLRQVVNVDLMLAQQRMLEGNIDAAVAVLNIEDHGVAADFAPVADDAHSVIAGRHHAGQVDGADFKIFGYRNGFLED